MYTTRFSWCRYNLTTVTPGKNLAGICRLNKKGSPATRAMIKNVVPVNSLRIKDTPKRLKQFDRINRIQKPINRIHKYFGFRLIDIGDIKDYISLFKRNRLRLTEFINFRFLILFPYKDY